MPIYLLWGFRWPRQLVTVYIIRQKIDDAAPEWLMSPTSSGSVLESFEELFPEQYAALPHLRLVEQYDPTDEQIKSQPYAYVAARWLRIDLSADVDETISKGVPLPQQRALCGIRDALGCESQKCGWYIVFCGDEVRAFDDNDDEDDDEEDYEPSETEEATSEHEKPSIPPARAYDKARLPSPTAADPLPVSAYDSTPTPGTVPEKATNNTDKSSISASKPTSPLIRPRNHNATTASQFTTTKESNDSEVFNEDQGKKPPV